MVEDEGHGSDEGSPPSLEPDDGVQVVRTGGRLKWIAAFVGAVAVIAGLVVVIGQGDDIDPDQALEEAQELVEATESYRFELLESRRVVVGDPDGAGSDTTTRYLTSGSVADADHWRVVESDGFDPELDYETVRDGSTAYSNGATIGMPQEDGLDVPDWTAGTITEEPTVAEIAEMYASYPEELDDPESEDYDPQYAAEQRLDLAMTGYLLPLSDDPSHVKRLVADAKDPVVEEQLTEGGVRLRARLAPVPEVVEASDMPIPPVDLVLDLDRERRPTVARFTAEVDGASQDVEVRYLDWGQPVSIQPPSEDEVDRTPWLPEEALEANPELLVVPTELPDGWTLAFAFDSYSESASAGFGEPPTEDEETMSCHTLHLSYTSVEQMAFDPEEASEEELDRFYDSLDMLAVSISPTECYQPLDGGSFLTGPGGLPETREVRFEDVVVVIDSSLDDAAVDRVEQSLRRVSLDELAAMFPPDIGDEQSYPFLMGGPFG